MKPITPERRAEIRRIMDAIGPDYYLHWECLEELLAAEEYWRSAIANATLLSEYHCEFCHEMMGARGLNHKEDCPWLLAKSYTPSAI